MKKMISLAAALALILAMGLSAHAADFRDVAADDYFADAVAWAYSKGITSGTSETAFSPYEPCLRCQIMTFLYLAFAE